MNLPESSFFLKTRSVPSADLIITLSFDLIIVLFIRLLTLSIGYDKNFISNFFYNIPETLYYRCKIFGIIEPVISPYLIWLAPHRSAFAFVLP